MRITNRGDAMNTPKFNTWNDYFAHLEGLSFRMYDAPALPGGYTAPFPAAHSRPMLDTELKVGDRVRITLKKHAFDGETGTISRVPNIPFNEYTVEFEGFGAGYYRRSEFEVVEPVETLGQEYCEWSDRVNQGWTTSETIDELRRQNEMLHTIVADLKDRLSKAEREVVFLRHKPAARR